MDEQALQSAETMPIAGVASGYVISLARRADRRERFLQWNADKGIDFTIVDAVDGETLNREALLRANLIDDQNLRISPGHLGNALSHRAMWEKCVALARPILVFEDDAFLAPTLPAQLDRVFGELANGCGILYLGYNRDAIVSVGFGSDWCNIAFTTPPGRFEYHARQHGRWSVRNSHCVLDTRIVWGTLAYAVSPSGAQSLLRHCFPLSGKLPVRMYGAGRMLAPFSLDGMINVAVQRGLVKARVVFPPLAVGPNDQRDSNTRTGARRTSR
jgi:glycosyl transferase, family 25